MVYSLDFLCGNVRIEWIVKWLSGVIGKRIDPSTGCSCKHVLYPLWSSLKAKHNNKIIKSFSIL